MYLQQSKDFFRRRSPSKMKLVSLAQAILLLCGLCCSSATNLTDFNDFDRMSVWVGEDDGERNQRVQLCKPSHIKTGTSDACILAPIPTRLGYIPCDSGHPLPHTFYTDTLDTLALSAFIYEITKLRAAAKTNSTDLYASLQSPLSFKDAHNFLDNNIDLMYVYQEGVGAASLRFLSLFCLPIFITAQRTVKTK